MAVIRDVMPAFQLLQPTSIADAQKLLEQQGHEGMVFAGGMDAFDWLKDRIRKPKTVVDLSGVEEMRGIRAAADLPDRETHPLRRFRPQRKRSGDR